MAPKEVQSAAEFDSQLASAGSKLVVVDFHAIAPTFASLASKHAANAVFLKVDVDGVKAIAQRYSVRAMPTFIFLKNRAVIDTIRGADPGKLTALVQKHAAAGSAFSGSGSTLGGGASSSSGGSRAGSTGATPTPRTNPIHSLSDRNIQLETVLPLLLLGAYLIYILS
ncbi:hypothetical protein OC842_007122 [Tilletia horrida]|uniref:Thioredoxin domain-containing protein n=1 Tax=Tilletia horrida TaxID=155126 RepID=A0AAN6G4A9_9BASI|nr:hypothetical protein OC842_007122 [Tilletia horrida]